MPAAYCSRCDIAVYLRSIREMKDCEVCGGRSVFHKEEYEIPSRPRARASSRRPRESSPRRLNSSYRQRDYEDRYHEEARLSRLHDERARRIQNEGMDHKSSEIDELHRRISRLEHNLEEARANNQGGSKTRQGRGSPNAMSGSSIVVLDRHGTQRPNHDAGHTPTSPSDTGTNTHNQPTAKRRGAGRDSLQSRQGGDREFLRPPPTQPRNFPGLASASSHRGRDRGGHAFGHGWYGVQHGQGGFVPQQGNSNFGSEVGQRGYVWQQGRACHSVGQSQRSLQMGQYNVTAPVNAPSPASSARHRDRHTREERHTAQTGIWPINESRLEASLVKREEGERVEVKEEDME